MPTLGIKSILIIIVVCFANFLHAQIKIIVNKNNPTNNITIVELKQIYLGNKTTFSNGKNIILMEQNNIKERFYDQLLGWSTLKIKKYWMRLIFSGENSIAPKEFKNLNRLKDFILANEGAIAFVHLTEPDTTLKFLTVEGMKPENKDYPLK